MEIIGKVLCITLLTIFGSAAATLYLVDSDIMPSIFGQPAIYTSDEMQEPDDNIDTYSAPVSVPERREGVRESMHYTVVKEETEDVPEYGSAKPIWGHSYEAHSTTEYSARAREIATSSSLDSIINGINYWNERYSSARSEGSEEAARYALRNYTEYKEALVIKQTSGR